MRHWILPILGVFVMAPSLSATETDPAEASVAEVVPSIVSQAEPDAEAALQLTEVAVEERATPSDAAAAQLGPRGGFWWIVGVIVVAGVILAVIL